MSVSKQITIYEPPDTASDKKQISSDEFNDSDLFTNDEARRYDRIYTADMPISSSMPSMLIKNIIYNVLPIVDSKSPIAGAKSIYNMHVQVPIPIKIAILGKGIFVKRENDIISMIGIYFDSEATFFQFNPMDNNLADLTQQNRFFLGANGLRDIAYIYDALPVPRTCMYFTQQQLSKALEPVRFAVRFNNSQDALMKIKLISKFMKSRALYFRRMYKYISSDIFKQPESLIITNAVRVERARIGSNSVIDVMEKLSSLKLRDMDPMYVKSILGSLGLYYIYSNMMLNGTENATSFLEEHNKEVQTIKTILSHKKQFDIDNAKQAWFNNISMREFESDFSALSDQQKEIVQNQYAQEYNIAAATRTNKCPHLPLQQRVMRSKNGAFDTVAWRELKKYVPLRPKPMKNGVTTLPTYKSGLQCNICHLWALCPHHYVLFDMKDDMFNGDEEKTMEYLILHFSIDKQSDDDAYFCRICGELLKKNMVEGEVWASRTTTALRYNDALGNIIRTEVWQTLISNLDTGTITIDMPVLANNIVEIINPFIRRFEVKLTRVKTNTENMITFSLYLIISAYTFVIIIHLSNITGGEITLKGLNTKGLKGTDLLHKLFNYAYKLIIVQRANTINKIPAFTPDRIKKILTRGYQQISGSHISIETRIVEHFDDPLSNNPVYAFLHYGWTMAALTSGKSPPLYSDSNTIIGTDIMDISSLKMIFENAKMPAKWNISDSYYWDSYSAAASRIITNTFMRDQKNKNAIDKEQTALKKRWDIIVAKHASLHNIRSEIPKNWTSDRKIVPVNDLLASVFDSDGKRHKWNIYVYEGIGKSPRRVEVNEGQFDNANLDNMTYVTQKCSICGDLFGESKSANIVETISRNKNIVSFFRYYDYRCPIKYIHTFVSGKCSQCGVTKARLKAFDISYYDKYKESFFNKDIEVIRKSKQSLSINEEHRRLRESMIVTKKDRIGKLYKPWSYKNDSLLKLSKIMNISYNVIINIGFMSNYDFDDIKKSKSNPSNKATDAMWLMQVSVIGAHIINFVSTYNRFTQCSVAGMHADLEEMCKRQHSDVRSLEPLNLTEYFLEREYRSREKPRIYANWMLFQLCDMVLRVHDSKQHPRINVKFAQAFIEELVEAELNTSKPKLYKRAVAAAKDATDNFGIAPMGQIEITDDVAKEVINFEEGTFNISEIDVDNYAESNGADEM